MIDIRATVLANGLLVTANNDARSYLAECYQLGGYPRAEDAVVEAIRHGTGLDWVSPEDIGALTDAPILGDVEQDDHGNVVKVHVVYWYPDYQVRDPWEILKNKGRVFLPKGE